MLSQIAAVAGGASLKKAETRDSSGVAGAGKVGGSGSGSGGGGGYGGVVDGVWQTSKPPPGLDMCVPSHFDPNFSPSEVIRCGVGLASYFVALWIPNAQRRTAHHTEGPAGEESEYAQLEV